MVEMDYGSTICFKLKQIALCEFVKSCELYWKRI